MLAAVHSAMTTGLRLPNELTLLGRTLVNLDEVARTLAPDFEVRDSWRRKCQRSDDAATAA